MDDQEDKSLVRRFKRGDDGCFDRIYEKYKVSVYSICYRYARNEADACDLTQDVFIKIYRNLCRFNERSKLFTWIYRITVNTCISFKRRERKTQYMPQLEAQRDPVGERVGLKVAIDNALLKLPSRQRLAFVLRHHEGYTFEEVGRIMGTTTGAAKANHYHAVRKMREYLKDWL